MHTRWLRLLGLLLFSTVPTASVVSAQGPPDVVITIANGQVDDVKPYVKGLCKTPHPVKGDCATNVVWKVAGLRNGCQVVIAQKSDPPQAQCFAKTSWTVTSSGQPADSGPSQCVGGQVWKYDVTLKCEDEADVVVDPIIVIDY